MEVDDLRLAYGATTAVDGLSLTVARGSITAVLGPNGAGHTQPVDQASAAVRSSTVDCSGRSDQSKTTNSSQTAR